MQAPDTFFSDGIGAIAIHNGVVRIQFMRLSMDGKRVPSREQQDPVAPIKSVADAIRKLATL